MDFVIIDGPTDNGLVNKSIFSFSSFIEDKKNDDNDDHDDGNDNGDDHDAGSDGGGEADVDVCNDGDDNDGDKDDDGGENDERDDNDRVDNDTDDDDGIGSGEGDSNDDDDDNDSDDDDDDDDDSDGDCDCGEIGVIGLELFTDTTWLVLAFVSKLGDGDITSFSLTLKGTRTEDGMRCVKDEVNVGGMSNCVALVPSPIAKVKC